MLPDTWIIVVNWNGAELLPRCLAALAAQSHPAHILVVDNGSTDASAAATAAFPSVQWLPLGRNLGFAAANNAGFRVALTAGARWIAIINTDVEAEPGWLRALVTAGEAHPQVGLLGGLLLFADDPSRVNSTGVTLDRFGRARDRDFGIAVTALATSEGPVPAVTGGAALLRGDLLRQVGLFDPAYWAYYEDVDLSFRAAEAGFGCWYVPAARARHGFGKTFGVDSPRQRFFLARNHLRFVATHLPAWRAAPIALAFAALRATVKAPLELARGRPALAAAHLHGAVAGGQVAMGELLRRSRGACPAVPPGAEPSSPSSA
ncbi:MAG TPA: glycosyltransferase family 2 protein, partial [Anaeromyxobacteraceae bacterium]|nr:glycosyltransferase family 2 protein [Anaeromyxobacteraceae bacterium]